MVFVLGWLANSWVVFYMRIGFERGLNKITNKGRERESQRKSSCAGNRDFI